MSLEPEFSEFWDLLLPWDSGSLYHLGIIMEKITSILNYTGTHSDKNGDGGMEASIPGRQIQHIL